MLCRSLCVGLRRESSRRQTTRSSRTVRPLRTPLRLRLTLAGQSSFRSVPFSLCVHDAHPVDAGLARIQLNRLRRPPRLSRYVPTSPSPNRPSTHPFTLHRTERQISDPVDEPNDPSRASQRTGRRLDVLQTDPHRSTRSRIPQRRRITLRYRCLELSVPHSLPPES
jgi:hypothetical protein